MTTGPRDYPDINTGLPVPQYPTIDPRGYSDWRTRQPASPVDPRGQKDPTRRPLPSGPGDLSPRDYSDYYRDTDRQTPNEVAYGSAWQKAKPELHDELVRSLMLWGVPDPSETDGRLMIDEQQAEQIANYLYATVMPDMRAYVNSEIDAGLMHPDFAAYPEATAEKHFYNMNLINVQNELYDLYDADSLKKFLKVDLPFFQQVLDKEKKALEKDYGLGMFVPSEQDIIASVLAAQRDYGRLYSIVEATVLQETDPDSVPTRRQIAQWMKNNNLIDPDNVNHSYLVDEFFAESKKKWKHHKDMSYPAPPKSFGMFLTELLPKVIAEGVDVATQLPPWAQKTLTDAKAAVSKLEEATKPTPYLSLTPELGQELEDLANIMRDTNPDPAANAPNPDAQSYADASDRRDAILESRTVNLTAEELAAVEAATASTEAILKQQETDRKNKEAARKAAIASAPLADQAEQILAGWMNEQNVSWDERELFLQRYSDLAFERYQDRLGKQLAQGITADDQISFQESVTQDMEEGLIDSKMGEQNWGRSDTLEIDPVTGLQRPLLFSAATDPRAEEYTPERIDEIVSGETKEEDAFAAFLRAKLADPKFKEQYRQEQAKARTEFAESPTMKAAFEQAYKGSLRGWDYGEKFVTPSIPPGKMTNGYQPFVDPDEAYRQSQMDERGEKVVVGVPTTPDKSKYKSLTKFYDGPGLRELGRDVSFEDYSKAQMGKLKEQFGKTPEGRVFAEAEQKREQKKMAKQSQRSRRSGQLKTKPMYGSTLNLYGRV